MRLEIVRQGSSRVASGSPDLGHWTDQLGLLRALVEENNDQVHAVDEVSTLQVHSTIYANILKYLQDGRTPLHAAASCNQDAVEAVSLLLEHGAKVDHQDPSEWTPLHCAGMCYT